MVASITGTPVFVTWGNTINPSGQSITIPSDATAVYMFWSYLSFDGTGLGLASVTLAGNNPAQIVEKASTTSPLTVAAGLAVWYSPTTGSQTLDPAWDGTPEEDGPTTIVAFVKDGDTTSWRASGANSTASTAACSVTIASSTTDLVLKCDQRWQALPGTSAGWTSLQTGDFQGFYARLSSSNSPGASTTVCASDTPSTSSIVAVSIPEGAGGGGASKGFVYYYTS